MLRAIVVVVLGIDSGARWMTVAALAADADLDGDQSYDDGLWQPSRTAGASSAAVAAARTVRMHASPSSCSQDSAEDLDKSPPRTYMKCVGTTTTTRACHFQNVYYDISSTRFVYYGPAGATPDLFGEGDPRRDPWLRLIRGAALWKGRQKSSQFFLDFRPGAPLPPVSTVATFTQPLHLRVPMHTRSLGHFLRDNLLALIDLPMRFGRDPADFDWVRWHSTLGKADWQQESHVAEHYRGLSSNRPSVTWQQVLDKALADQPSSVKYIRFAEIIGGQGPVDLLSHFGPGRGELERAQWAHMCDPFPFTAMREVAYRNHGLQVASVPELEPFVLFMDGRPGEKRYLANGGEIIPKLQHTFPGVRMEHVMISKLTLAEQLQLLSKATVVVTNVGSRSFRLIYLPNGATTILVGPPEYSFMSEPAKRGAKARRQKNATPFYEIDNCWGFIGYVNMLQYHVTTQAEVRKIKPWQNPKDARDSDIVLDETKLTALLRVALQEGDCNRPYTGSGTLAAYRAPTNY